MKEKEGKIYKFWEDCSFSIDSQDFILVVVMVLVALVVMGVMVVGMGMGELLKKNTNLKIWND